MAYTTTWNTTYESQPDGAAVDADTLDTIIQEFKVAIRERMNSIITDWTADPVVLKPSVIVKTGQILVVGPQGMNPLQDEDDILRTDGYFQSDNSGTNTALLALSLLKNWNITKVEVVVDRGTDTSMTIFLSKTSLITVPVTSLVNSVVKSSSGVTVETVFTGTEVVDGTSAYVLQISGADAGRWKFYGAKITYNEI